MNDGWSKCGLQFKKYPKNFTQWLEWPFVGIFVMTKQKNLKDDSLTTIFQE